mmetsp:Transcript_22819/g.31306  ORF Transcript_22819/g.31306 Transcript_22819/m.31306 type:complete len:321 (+) Transcript_22819:35-997(+)|eukprot:CAMPEP_0201487512 /NCGR_PEP_ID=MMETSP0151_2-20130828/13831_1 /ASSEMBLY_ACC=CAM_ASM_000257 /TAXON_ID=200890 /ORGANISM="Paramoeba atlantica, Strain 621/1 / CCAP 1560/9" /LENGTH=320 /DNA_ID=CAMNT_0047872565 /DNA_START=33 /DNA_END=995 /DNA_ORIENTATION=+
MADEAGPGPKYNRGRRKAVSAASDTKENTLEEGWEPKVFPKSPEESQRIRNVMDKNILFKYLDDEQRKIILDAMFEVKKSEGDVVIRQGEEGDNFYVIDAGVSEIFVNQKEGPPLLVLTCKDGDSFGELALMYDAPRAATVICKTDMKLWAMDRLTYKHILMGTTLKKRNMYKDFLEKVSLLDSLDPYERLKVADLLESKTYAKDEIIINEGEEGETFYIVEKGSVECLQKYDGDKIGCVGVLGEGDYFGERALLLDSPRACTVKAVSPEVRVLLLDRSSFNMVLGPVEDVLKRNIDQYKTYQQMIEEGSLPEFAHIQEK